MADLLIATTLLCCVAAPFAIGVIGLLWLERLDA